MAPEASDDELIERVGNGDVFAYTVLVRRYVGTIYRSAYRMLHDSCEAEDVAQESFARLWQNGPRWKSAGAGVPGWLRRVCTNLCLDRLRKSGRWSLGEMPDIADSAISAERLIEQEQIQEILEDSLRALSINHRTAIVLTYFEGYSNKMAAEALEMDIKAFESLLHRARGRLGVLLSQGGLVSEDLGLLA